MRTKVLLAVSLALGGLFTASAQTIFDQNLQMPAGFVPDSVLMPPSPLTTQVLFIGGTDMVQAPATYGYPAGPTLAKEWHDFIGFTPDNNSTDLGWISVNHEMIYRDDRLGDGGGMTVFKVRRMADGTLETVEQTLTDGRRGKFFGVDFVNTVGETGMNCGGISSMVDGRIWTAEEWFRNSNRDINDGNTSSGSSYPLQVGSDANQGVRDTSDFTISTDVAGDWNGMTLKKYQNFNYMVEIDPREAVAIRKQYNWGRQPFEGGAVEPGNRVVYLGPDATPGFFGMFVAETPGDFTKGTVFAYKHDKPGYKWTPIWGTDDLLNHHDAAARKGATMYNRIEWVAIDPTDNHVYFTETGRDFPGRAFGEGEDMGGVYDPYHVARAASLGMSSPRDRAYPDFYGRIWRYDPVRDTLTVFLEGGPFLQTSPTQANYPAVHLSNPDGLNIMKIDGRSFLVINEDLNGRSYGRVPAGVNNSTCEVFLLDLDIDNPTLDDLIRITAVPKGAEVTGACPTPDGKSLLLNVQHPDTQNEFPYNHSLTFAIHGFDQVRIPRRNNTSPRAALTLPEEATTATDFELFPNPTTRFVRFNGTHDVAVYNAANGQRVMVRQQVDRLDVSELAAGAYVVKNGTGTAIRLIVQ